MTQTLLDTALAYARRGWSVFPCHPRSKIPATPRGFKDATTDERVIRLWWERICPEYNVAIATGETSGLYVLDIDVKPGRSLDDAIENLGIEIPDTPTVRTGGGGVQYFFEFPKGSNLSISGGKLGNGIDTRGNGGYVVAPPSIHPNGNTYTWMEFEDAPLAPTPALIISKLDTQKTNALLSSTEKLTGGRHDTLMTAAALMRGIGLVPTEIFAALDKMRARLDLSDGRKVDDKEIHDIANWCGDKTTGVVNIESLRHGEAIARSLIKNMGGAAKELVEEPTSRLVDPGLLPEHLLRVPGFINAAMDHCLATAPYPNTVLAFCGALALQAFLAGRKVCDSSGLRTNLYLLGLAHSASGKDWPRKLNLRLAHAADLGSHIGAKFASGEGLQDVLLTRPNLLFQTDEMDGLLQSVNRSKDARYESLMETLLTIYTSADSIFPMRGKAGNPNPGVIDQPCLSIFGTAIPNHYYAALSARMLTNGLFARMLIFEGGKRSVGQDASPFTIPEPLTAVAQWWANFKPEAGNLPGLHPKPKIIGMTPSAKACLDAMRTIADKEYSACEKLGDPVGTTVWGRANEHARKLALIYACSENHENPVIGLEAAQWGSVVVSHQVRRMLFMAQAHASDNPFDADCLKFMEILRAKNDGTITRRELVQRLRREPRRLKEIVETLVAQGAIDVFHISTDGRTRICYQLM